MILYFLESLFSSFFRLFVRLVSPNIIVCKTCKKVLHVHQYATTITEEICLVCNYKSKGGKFPRMPKLNDFAMYRALFNKKTLVIDEIWSSGMLHQGLIENGKIIERARLAKRSLTANPHEWGILSTVRKVALEHGITQRSINIDEMHGADLYRESMRNVVQS